MIKQRFFVLIFMSMLSFTNAYASTSINVIVEWFKKDNETGTACKDKHPNSKPTLIFRMFCSREFGEKTLTELEAFFKRATLVMPNKYLVVNVHEHKNIVNPLSFIFEQAESAQPSRLDFAPTHMIACAQHENIGCLEKCFESEQIMLSIATFLAAQIEILQPANLNDKMTEYALHILTYVAPFYSYCNNDQEIPRFFSIDTLKKIADNTLRYSGVAGFGLLIQMIITSNAIKNRFSALLPKAQPLEITGSTIIAVLSKRLPFVIAKVLRAGIEHDIHKRFISFAGSILNLKT